MRVCLINPPRLMKPMSVVLKPSPPLGLAFIAAALEAEGHAVTVIDALAEGCETYHAFVDDLVVNGLSSAAITARIPADVRLIGLSCMFSGNWLHHRELIDALGERFPHATLVAGGEHITAVPEFSLAQTRHLSVCVLGEGEETIVQVARALERRRPFSSVSGIAYRDADGEVVRTPRRARVLDLARLPRPAWHLFPLALYREKNITYGVQRGGAALPVLATRGCPYQCTFCSSPEMWGTRYVMREPRAVADEIEEYVTRFSVRNFDFYDLTAIIRKEWILAFCAELQRRALDITWQIPAGTRSEAIDAEVARALYASGCRNITYAPEAGSPRILRAIRKKVNLDRMLRSIAHSRRAGMNIKINFMMGFPEETHRDVWQSLWFLVRASWHGAHDTSPSILSPYPGSAMFEALRAAGAVDLEDDEYFRRIVYVDTLFKNHFYNAHISVALWRLYLVLYLIVFYGTNYLFHPTRALRTVYNVVTRRCESRAEMSLVDLVSRSRIHVLPREEWRRRPLRLAERRPVRRESAERARASASSR